MDLLGRARGFFKGLSAPAVDRVQYFSVVCPEGHRVRGQRTEGYQALRCPACGEGVFVLPASPLPEPEPPPRPAAARRPAVRRPLDDDAPLELKDAAEVTVEVADHEVRSADAEIIWEDGVEAEPAEGSSAAAAQAPGGVAPAEPTPARPPRKRSRPVTQPTGRPREQQIPSEPSPSRTKASSRLSEAGTDASGTGRAREPAPAGAALRKQRRVARPALIIVGLIILAAASATYRTWRSRLRQLPQQAEVGRVEGIAALEAGKFDKAYQLLAPARDAVDALKGDVEGAEEIRHAADEASIFVDLLSDSLETLLEQAARTRPQEWAARFDDLYKGRSVIIDATVAATPDSPGAGRYEIDYLVLPPGEGAGERRFARLDVADLELFTLVRPRVGDHVIFGARLAAFQYDADREAFVIRFEPRSGVAIRYTKALEALGWPSGTVIPLANPEEPAEP